MWKHRTCIEQPTRWLRGPSYLGLTRSISWLLMPWLLTSPGHQQPWHWLYRISKRLLKKISPKQSIQVNNVYTLRNHFVYAPSQWETMLQCNVISRWRGTFTTWSLYSATWLTGSGYNKDGPIATQEDNINITNPWMSVSCSNFCSCQQQSYLYRTVITWKHGIKCPLCCLWCYQGCGSIWSHKNMMFRSYFIHD